MIKPKKRIISFLLAVALVISTLYLPVSAASKVSYWLGKTALNPGVDYIVNSYVNMNEDFVVPNGTRIIVKSGGSLRIGIGATARVYGKIEIENGGKLYLAGKMTLNKGSTLTNNGSVTLNKGSELKIYGSLLMPKKTSVLKTEGTLTEYQGAFIYNSGDIYIRQKGSMRVSSTFFNTKGSMLEIAGSLLTSVNSDVTVNGLVNLMSYGVFKITGQLTIGRYSRFIMKGEMTSTRSAVISDKRIIYDTDLFLTSAIRYKYIKEMHGIDVSYAQGEIDWEAVGKDPDVDFVMIRCGRGDTGEKPIAVDTRFVENIEGALANGLDVGVYFYSYAASVAEIKAEAEFLVKLLSDYKLTFPVVIDMEESYQYELGADTVKKMLQTFYKILSTNGYYPMLYSYYGWLEASGLTMEFRNKYPLWFAHCVEETTYEGTYYMWQYSYTGKVDGIKGDVDLDIAYRNFPLFIKNNKLNNN